MLVFVTTLLLTVFLLSVLVVGGWLVVVRSVETPAYETIAVDGAFELRDYPALLAAEVERTGARDAAVRAGFRPLARYIFARGREGPKIAMTAPVTQLKVDSPVEDPAAPPAWRVRFLMPSKYAMDGLPAPSPGVRLVQVPAQRQAAVRFSGRAEDDDFERQEARLGRWLVGQGLRPGGAATYAYYDDPFIPGFLRRNEVLMPVAETTGLEANDEDARGEGPREVGG